MNNEVEKKEKFEIEFRVAGGLVKLNPTIVRKYLVHGKAELVTDTEIVMYMQLCKYQGLNPFLRDCYLIKYSSSDPAAFVVGKDTFTKRAGAIPECGGFNAGVIVRRKVEGKEEIAKRTGALVMQGEELIGGWGRAYRKGWQEAVEIEVGFKEYIRYTKTGDVNKSWREMPATMIRKVALVQVLRETFAEHYANMYAPEEMPIDDSALPQEPVQFPESEKVFVRDDVQSHPEPVGPGLAPAPPPTPGTPTEQPSPEKPKSNNTFTPPIPPGQTEGDSHDSQKEMMDRLNNLKEKAGQINRPDPRQEPRKEKNADQELDIF